jgi:hypothetical protein
MHVRFSTRGGLAVALFSLCSLTQAAFIDPADSTGSLAADPGTWAATFPAMNTNTVQAAVPLFLTEPGAISATNRTLAPWTRGSANTTYQGWDRMFATPLVGTPIAPNSSALPNEVDADSLNPYGTATLTTTLPGAFSTGGGNIYSPTSATAFSLAIPNANLGAGYQTNFLIQVRAATGQFDFGSFQINGTPISTLANYSVQLLDRFIYGSGFGDTAALDYKLEFTLEGNSALDTITFGSAGPGLSLDKIYVDTNVSAVPEPSSFIFAGLSAAMGTVLYRRRKSANRA